MVVEELFCLQDDLFRIDLAPLAQDFLWAVLYKRIRNPEPFYQDIMYPSVSKGLENGAPKSPLKRIFLNYQNPAGA